MAKTHSIQQRSSDLARLIEKRLGVGGGRGLEAKIKKAGRRMPRWVRREALQIVDAERMMGHPKLMMQAQAGGLDQAFQKCEAWLKSVDPSARRRAFWLNLLTVNVFNMIVLLGLVLVALKLTGLA